MATVRVTITRENGEVIDTFKVQNDAENSVVEENYMSVRIFDVIQHLKTEQGTL